MLYILCVEVLARKVQDNPKVVGFSLPGMSHQFKVGQYVDDSTTSFTV